MCVCVRKFPQYSTIIAIVMIIFFWFFAFLRSPVNKSMNISLLISCFFIFFPYHYCTNPSGRVPLEPPTLSLRAPASVPHPNPRRLPGGREDAGSKMDCLPQNDQMWCPNGKPVPSHQVICVFYDCMSVPRVISGILTNNGLCTTNSCQYINLSSPQFKGFTPMGSAPTLQPFAGICDNLHKLAVTSNWRLQTRDPLGQKDLGLNRSKMRTNNNSSGRNQSRSPSDFKRAGIVPCGILWSLLFKIWANACLPKQLFTPLTKIRGR